MAVKRETVTFAELSKEIKDGKFRNMASLSSKYPQIDLILAGHSHQTEPGKRLYPGAWFVQAPPLGAGCAQITVEVDPAAPLV